MDYLKDEFERYRNRAVGQTFGDVLPLKLQTYTTFVQDLLIRTKPATRAQVLEVGSGSGISLALLSREGASCTAIDSSVESCAYTSEVAREYMADVRVVQGDGSRSPFRDKEFTLSFSFGLIEHLAMSDQRSLVEEMIRVSRDLVIIGIPNTRTGSGFDMFAKNSRKYDHTLQHLEVDIFGLIRELGARVIYSTGLNVFLTKSEAGGAADWLEFHTLVTGKPLKKSCSLSDVDPLVSCELALSDKVRLEKGFLIYVVAEVRAGAIS
jgi:SAM-dependent methyltransferase